ncbi:uncharacterized protein ACHE_40101A [Aspergillus chevalieri]|uniref:Uncharacterized protein n=1 Tax=Aspergillus chevalieri TaxID=182096 RepID=A0A7R7VMP8_ASPCH|nr:uncharacterized protein ACHE_40101A [Aspergillus chevalieri]BCR87537.1 hypothetical protein ACHE_40101A [Aspergillus chevalieri]
MTKEVKSAGRAYENVHRYPACSRVFYYVRWILIMLAVGSIALPVEHYVKCRYYQKNEKAACRGESNSVMIVLGCAFLVWWPIERAMFYLARQYVRNPTQ